MKEIHFIKQFQLLDGIIFRPICMSWDDFKASEPLAVSWWAKDATCEAQQITAALDDLLLEHHKY